MADEPELDENLAEVIGIIIGDGCISEYKPKAQSKTRLVLLITGSWEMDINYYEKFIQPVINKAFGIPGRIYHRKDDNTVRYWITKRSIIEWFIRQGLSKGPKINRVEIPDKIIQNVIFAMACIRGIFNTDGCIYRRYSKQYKSHSKYYANYAVAEIRIKSEKLMNQISDILKAIGIKPTAVTKTKLGLSVLRITSQPDLKKFIELIKPREYHLKRYETIVNTVGP
jgi:intein/homing endonuclease